MIDSSPKRGRGQGCKGHRCAGPGKGRTCGRYNRGSLGAASTGASPTPCKSGAPVGTETVVTPKDRSDVRGTVVSPTHRPGGRRPALCPHGDFLPWPPAGRMTQGSGTGDTRHPSSPLGMPTGPPRPTSVGPCPPRLAQVTVHVPKPGPEQCFPKWRSGPMPSLQNRLHGS